VIHDVVMNTDGVMEYQMIVSNAVEGDALSPDRLLLRIGLDPAGRGTWDDVALRAAVKHATEVTPEVELVMDLTEIYDPGRDFKATRIVDIRIHE
jgi:hypothetical protein